MPGAKSFGVVISVVMQSSAAIDLCGQQSAPADTGFGLAWLRLNAGPTGESIPIMEAVQVRGLWDTKW